MLIKDVMTRDVKAAEVPGTRAEAIELLRKLHISAIPVIKRGSGELMGMVTLRKLFELPDEDQLAMLIDRDVPTVSPEDKLEEAVTKLLRSRVRRMPVMKDGKLVGVITVRDIVYRAVAEMNTDKPAADYMSPHSTVIWEGTPLRAAIEIMALLGFRGIPVINEAGNLVGMIDDSDIIKVSDIEVGSRMSQMAGSSEGDKWSWDSEDRIYITKSHLKVPNKLVKDIMAKDLVAISRKTPVNRAAQLMKQNTVEQTPVLTADGKLVGIVRDTDLLRILTE